MSITGIVIAAAVMGITGLAVGLLLGAAGKKFAVEVDEKEIKIREQLPGNNCGGCGYAGCDALAKAISNGEASVNACPVGGEPVGDEISKIMGVTVEKAARMTAFVKCSGTCDKAGVKYDYYGIYDCKKVALVPGSGDKKCSYGCLGYGSCVKACQFDAIHIVNGIAEVDKEKCKACGKCVTECPNHLIELIPYDYKHVVKCSSKDKGKAVKDVCKTGCLGCGLCVRQCEAGAITLENNIAHIDQDKCTGCGKCAEKCPAKVIV